MSQQSHPTIWTIALAVSVATLLAVSANGQDTEEKVSEPSIRRDVLAPVPASNQPTAPPATRRGAVVMGEPLMFDPSTPSRQPLLPPQARQRPPQSNMPTHTQPNRETPVSAFPPARVLGDDEIRRLHIEIERLQKLAQLNFAGAAKPKNLAPLEDGVLRAFRLQHIAPDLLARTLESFLGESQLRLVPDAENHMLIVYAKENVLEQISELVETLDQNPESQHKSDKEETIEAQSLLIRIFWLADGLPEDEGSAPNEYLPDSVIEAVEQLGLKAPRLITQSSTSVYAVVDDGTEFNFNFPALIHGETVWFKSHGWISLTRQPAHDPPMPMLELKVEVQGGQNPIELSGELAAPLSHYMVLGTTNYATGGRSVGRGGGRAMGSADSPPQAQPTTSRFAFVVQIIEAKSYAPEKESSDSHDSEKLGIISD